MNLHLNKKKVWVCTTSVQCTHKLVDHVSDGTEHELELEEWRLTILGIRRSGMYQSGPPQDEIIKQFSNTESP